MKLDFDSIIVGAGVSGMTASIYLKRAGKNFLILEQNYPGGQLNRALKVENYPGVISIDGPELVMNIVSQLNSLDVQISYEKVIKIEDKLEYKIVYTNKNEYKTKTILLATGRIPRELGLENEKSLVGKGISWCASCDGNLYKNKVVAVIGGGNTAIDDAIYLSNICKKVYLINRTTNFRANELTFEQIKTKNNVQVMSNKIVVEINENNDKLESIKLDDGTVLQIDGLFEAIGNIPAIDYIDNLDIKTDSNYIIVDEFLQTSIKGIFASGDAIKKELYQIVTATGEGALAADSIIKYLK